jgi:hypothetical protein
MGINDENIIEQDKKQRKLAWTVLFNSLFLFVIRKRIIDDL